MTPQDESYRNHTELLRLPMDEVRALYDSGLSLSAVGKRFSVSATAISKHMRLHGMPLRRPGAIGHRWGKDHPMWKGDNAHYTSLHERLTNRFGKPQKCEECGTTDPARTYEWANLTGNYRDMNDYKRMCRSCHKQFDWKRKVNGDKLHGGATKPLPPYPANAGVSGRER
jgi:hypothetical protein